MVNEPVVCTKCIKTLPLNRNLASGFCENYVMSERELLNFLEYEKGSSVRRIIHEIKYKNGKELAFELGRLFGLKISGYIEKREGQVLVPVPLYHKKEKRRGYNQSLFIAKGLSEALLLPVNDNLISRERDTDTQTSKNKIDRILNMNGAFKMLNAEEVSGRSIILVDDVYTTGSTTEACKDVLYEHGAKEVITFVLAKAL